MPATTLEQKALRLLSTFEAAGKSVSRITVEGRKIELVLTNAEDGDEFAVIDMRHGKA